MAKDDKQKLYDTSMGKVKQADTQYNDFFNKNQGRGDTTWDRGTEDYNKVFQGYSDYASGGGLTQEDKDRMQAAINQYGSSGGGGGGGGYVWNNINNPLAGKTSAYASAYRPDYGESDTGFRKLSSASGGFDQGQLDQIYGNTGKLSEIGRTGGITDEDKANINRQSILDQEKTGGYSDQDKALIRAKSAASSPAYFSALKDNLERQRGQTGNLANAGAVDYKLARQSAQQQAQDRMASEIGLGESVRKGRESAGQFLSQQGMSLAGLRTANELAGARSAGDLGLNTQMGITANQAQGLKGLQESQTGLGQWGLGQAGGLDTFTGNQAQLDYQTQLANAQGNMQAGAGNASASNANAARAAAANAEYQQWLTEYGNQQKQYGIGGLHDLYNTNLGASMDYSKLGLDTLNSSYGTQGDMLRIASQNRGNTKMENAGAIAGMSAGVIGALTGTSGLSGLGGNPNQNIGRYGSGSSGYIDPRSGFSGSDADKFQY